MARKEALIKRLIRGITRLYWATVSRYRARFGQSFEADPDRPWLDEYTLFNIPATLEPYPNVPLHQFLRDAAADHPDNGLIQLDELITYPTLLEHAERLATALEDRGVRPGDRVASILPTSVQFVIVDAAVSMAGAVHVPNDTIIARDDLQYRLEESEPTVLVCDEAHRTLGTDLASSVGVDQLVLTALEDYSGDPPEHDPLPDAEWLTDLIATSPRDPPAISIDPVEDVHTLLFTGGTTGRPKGVLLTHRNLVANVLQTNSLSSGVSMGGSSTSLLAQPLYHAYGYTAMHARIANGGSVALVADARDVEAMASLITEHGIRLVSGVPTQFMNLLEKDLDRKLIAISGSAPLADEVRTAFSEDHIGITQGYGLSEMSPVTHVDIRGLIDSLTDSETSSDRFDHPCIGIPVPDTQVELIDTDTRERIPSRRPSPRNGQARCFSTAPSG
ncbi:MAG: long-chain fatty acid--CoA ligase [Natrialbaceae archaeon]|nr:long-chain fatty acid--CoA ligase [Natrialbaceae archaeon]